MTIARKSTGSRGEADTVAFLEVRGYRIVDTNVRPLGGMARGEIDVIAWDGEYLVFCEVKTRRVASGNQGTPAEAVDARKQKQLTRLAFAYLAKHDLDDVDCRFDVVEVVRRPPAPAQFTLLRDAFPPAQIENS
ncbi:MAG: YraN family protein [Janthinobacterium lividum]